MISACVQNFLLRLLFFLFCKKAYDTHTSYSCVCVCVQYIQTKILGKKHIDSYFLHTTYIHYKVDVFCMSLHNHRQIQNIASPPAFLLPTTYSHVDHACMNFCTMTTTTHQKYIKPGGQILRNFTTLDFVIYLLWGSHIPFIQSYFCFAYV